MRVAALFDIHGNLPALEAVLEEIRREGVDHIVIGGDVIPGPMPRETLQRLLELDLPVQFIHGNGELAVLAQMAAAETGEVTYWGTTSGAPPPEPIREVFRWTARQLQLEHETRLASWPKTLQFELPRLGVVLFCHGTPNSETEVFSRITPEVRLLPLFEHLQIPLAVCGHTHMQFDRMIGTTRVLNAGSVGSPYGEPGAYWLLLGPETQLRHTSYDLAEAAERIRAMQYPQAEEFAENLLHPTPEEEMLKLLAEWEAG